MDDSQSPEWVYPGVSYFAWKTVQAECAKCDLYPEWRRDYRQFFTTCAPSNYHDWVRITNVKDPASRNAVKRFRQAAALAVLGKCRWTQWALSKTWHWALKLLR